MSLRHAVLGLLSERPASGYDLIKVFNVSLANVWPATQSQVYTELGKLAKGGLVSVAAEGPRGRKEYSITEAGLAELRHWITDVEPTRVRRDDMLLRVFFLSQIGREEAVAYLREQGEHAREWHEHLTSLLQLVEDEDADLTQGLATGGRLALEWGLRVTAVQQEWATWSEERIH
jgi:PadR family transcriptional regulator, regulatory protein AphA